MRGLAFRILKSGEIVIDSLEELIRFRDACVMDSFLYSALIRGNKKEYITSIVDHKEYIIVR